MTTKVGKCAAKAEAQRQAMLTGSWLKMCVFHATCELLPLVCLVLHDIPLVVGGFQATFMSISLIVSLFIIAAMQQMAISAFTVVFYFGREIGTMSATWFARIRNWGRK